VTTNISIYENSSAYFTSASGAMYNILGERVVHMFLRLPAQAGLPGDTTTKLPYVLTIDIGVCTETISVTGIVDSSVQLSGNPSKIELENAVRKWWDFGDVDHTLPIIQIASGQAYIGNVKSASFTQEGGLETWWNFEVIFSVRAKKT
jgi:hypothetical protein